MRELILEWKRSADKYQKLGRKADHDPVRQEGLLCRSEVYNYCASKLGERLQQAVQGGRADACGVCGSTNMHKSWCSAGHGSVLPPAA